jgi:hypothetical protein
VFNPELSPEEQAKYEEKGREAARKPDAEPFTIFTDGLGALGCGSLEEGPAHYTQRGFDEVMRSHA